MVMVSLPLIFGDDVEPNNLFQKGGKLFHKNPQQPEFRYVLVLQLIFQDTFRHFQMLQPILGEHFPMLLVILRLSKPHAFLFLLHQQLLLALLDTPFLVKVLVPVRRILKYPQNREHMELQLLSL